MRKPYTVDVVNFSQVSDRFKEVSMQKASGELKEAAILPVEMTIHQGAAILRFEFTFTNALWGCFTGKDKFTVFLQRANCYV